MATPSIPSEPIQLPSVPVPQKDFITYLSQHPNDRVVDLVEPFKAYESKLREVFSQQPTHEAAQDNHVNLVPIYAGHEGLAKVRARNVRAETPEETGKYMMPLMDDARLPNGSSAVVPTLQDFRTNFGIFSESSLADMDWSNVVVAGSAVTTALLPVPEKYKGSKRLLREYYHEKLAPASDVDLFIYGLNEEQAIEKIKQIDQKIRDAILSETTAVRTKHAITIASQYPVRHVQIVLRLYRSVSEILAGFDVDCACVAYDGKQVYASPRALASFVTQCNTIDLTRRSPSYENRLSKYARRGFEVYWPDLERSRIDPTIFERSFASTKGLARLLLLEKLPKQGDREAYLDQRRRERGRPNADRSRGRKRMISGNIKDEDEEVADWIDDDEDVSSYHTFSVPYGPKFHARKIERLLYTKDLLLNAEWNEQTDREVHLHRHPFFFGFINEIMHDCCGSCPVPVTDEEKEVAEVDSKIYISGDISFIKDDPGRQSVGSFNPITTDDWTAMAYLGDTALLCQAIVEGNLSYVEKWCSNDDIDINRRDYTGRTPLHLAVMSSTVEIVQCLIDHGARLVARLVDGKTALHLAAARGEQAMVKILLDKSEANEEEEAKKEEARRALKSREVAENANSTAADEKAAEEDEDYDKITSHEKESVAVNTEGSFVKIDPSSPQPTADMELDEIENEEDEPDIYDINVLAWDFGVSPLHLAILHAHEELLKLLVSEYGADLLVPAKPPPEHSWSAKGVALNLTLAMRRADQKAESLVRTLLGLGASSGQADPKATSAFHFAVALKQKKVLDIFLQEDLPAAKRVINHISQTQSWGGHYSRPLVTAVFKHDGITLEKLLHHGASPTVNYEDWAKAFPDLPNSWYIPSLEEKKGKFYTSVKQPAEIAIEDESPECLLKLLEYGVDPNSLTVQGHQVIRNLNDREYKLGETILDLLRSRLNLLRSYKGERVHHSKPNELQDDDHYLSPFQKGSYLYWSACNQVAVKRRHYSDELKQYEDEHKKVHEHPGITQKKHFIEGLIKHFEELESLLVSKGAKTFKELHPSIEPTRRSPSNDGAGSSWKSPPFKVQFRFNNSVTTEEIEEGYKRLFEAAWMGDIETIKLLTLAHWGANAENPPLMVAVKDSRGFSPFFIAIMRGHLSAARAIFDIADVQFEPPEEPRKQYNMADDEDDSDSEEGDQVPIYGELVDEKFTIDDLGAVSKTVKSKVRPTEMLCWAARISDQDSSQVFPKNILPGFEGWQNYVNPLRYAIQKNDAELTKYILSIGNEFAARLAQEDEPHLYEVGNDDFEAAVRLGAIGPLAEMIRISGAGLPLDSLSRRFGTQIKTQPKHYQGLSIYGRKRADWAQHGRNENIWKNGNSRPPLLIAAHAGCIESVEWFFSDAPARLYKEYLEENRDDVRVQALLRGSQSLDKLISSWLGTRKNLVAHCAVVRDDDSDSQRSLLNYLLLVAPKSLNTRSQVGYTPLSLAFYRKHITLARTLIAAGADQTTRDKTGRNIIHQLLADNYDREVDRVQKMLDLIDKRLLPGLFFERTAEAQGAQTPLVSYMFTASDQSELEKKEGLAVVDLLLKYSRGKDLEVLNSEGDTPLHICVRNGWPNAAALIMSHRPELVHRENATGRTPLEMAEDYHVREFVKNASNISIPTAQTYNNNQRSHALDKSYEDYARDSSENEKGPKDDRSNVERTYQACLEISTRSPQPRKLASLSEAHELAARLSRAQDRERASSERKSQNGDDADGDINMDECTSDEVSTWL
ncbi:ankyrin repeat protein [Xylona heveae TC161]|uniref:Ankyrin repeat protein n=1 Tax=Xylona heveae (strain CBS 132557 / TC161) TaxID=1328760 RepID=A0A165FLU2_XYLHT|nr:ankyrin repeat protein [Xylona heveae TC161]KZF21130.1 ankyrin repeat protein [Xylona heveae TC161]